MAADSFGSTLRSLRTQAGMSQEELASKAEVSRASVQNWEGGRREPRRAELRRLAAALGVDVATLTQAGEMTPLTREQIAERRAQLLSALAELDRLERDQSTG